MSVSKEDRLDELADELFGDHEWPRRREQLYETGETLRCMKGEREVKLSDEALGLMSLGLDGVYVHGILVAMASECPISIRCKEGRWAVAQLLSDSEEKGRQEIAGYGDTLAEAMGRWLELKVERNK